METVQVQPWLFYAILIVVSGGSAFCGALLRGWGQRIATKGVAEQVTRATEEIKREIQRSWASSDRRRFLVESLSERLDEARDHLVRFYRSGEEAPGVIVKGETLIVTDVARALRLHELELGGFHKLLFEKWDLAAHHIWHRDQGEESFVNNLRKFDAITKEIQARLQEPFG